MIELSMNEQLELQKAKYAVKTMTRIELESYALQALSLALGRQAAIRWLVSEVASGEKSALELLADLNR